MKKTVLSDAQKRVMKWIGSGWEGQQGSGAAVIVNGKRICNIDTMAALQRAGLVIQSPNRCWRATEEGRMIAKELSL